ncbi:MAG: translation initiation factor IF-2 subunit gamma [Candidatus Altiarchaeota archaeon]|nr:translation initiation factor IF-2 subunit gamma [Candidatus Altiarchaeota archaeon]
MSVKQESGEKPEVNIGMIGHVDHGKTTLTKALTGKWTDTFSEEIKKGITIKLGYANTQIYKDKDAGYNVEKKGTLQRCISFVDAPGHEALMAVMLTASAVMDGALLLVDAREGIRAQTREHAMAVKIAGIDKIIVVQNKIDAVKAERAKESYEEIKQFLKEFKIDAPIIPISALHKVNIDILLKTIEEVIVTAKRDPNADPKFLVVRSFDINRPGKKPETLIGGVLGGALVKGKLKVGDKIEILPGIKLKSGEWEPVRTEIIKLATEKMDLKEGTPGGNLAIGTLLDNSLTKRDSMLGSIIGHPGKMPPVRHSVKLKTTLFDQVLGIEGEEVKVLPLTTNEPLVMNVNTAVTIGLIRSVNGNKIEVVLKRPVCADTEDRFVLSRKFGNKWRLIGHGTIIG